jgi:hypothetical protein
MQLWPLAVAPLCGRSSGSGDIPLLLVTQVVFSPQHLAERLTPYPLPTKDCGVLRTIGDARAYMLLMGGYAPSPRQNIRLSSDAANPLSRSPNWRADGDGCDGLHLDAGVVQRLKGLTVCTVGSEPRRGSLSDRVIKPLHLPNSAGERSLRAL